MVSTVHGCVQVGANGPDFIHTGVKINGEHYREVLLTQKLLPVMPRTPSKKININTNRSPLYALSNEPKMNI